jgi:hypothetical protein
VKRRIALEKECHLMARRTDDKAATSRRGFFRIAVLGAGAAGALTVVGKATGAKAGAPAKAAAGYRETEHVKRVYALARF